MDFAALPIGATIAGGLVLFCTGIWTCRSDLRERLVPESAVMATASVGVLWLAFTGAGGGEWIAFLLSALVAGAFFAVPAYVRPGSIGFGDVKLAFAYGLVLGPAVIFALLISCLLGTVAGGVIALRSGVAVARKATIPFAPAIVVGALTVLCIGLAT